MSVQKHGDGPCETIVTATATLSTYNERLTSETCFKNSNKRYEHEDAYFARVAQIKVVSWARQACLIPTWIDASGGTESLPLVSGRAAPRHSQGAWATGAPLYSSHG